MAKPGGPNEIDRTPQAAALAFDHALPTSRTRLPAEHVFTGLAILAILLCIGAGIVIGRYQGAVTVNHTRTVNRTVLQQYGKPDTVVDGAQVNAQLAGWKCLIYVSRKTLICRQ